MKNKTQENPLEKINVLLSKEVNNAKRTSGVFGEINWQILSRLKELMGHFYLTLMSLRIDYGDCVIHQSKGCWLVMGGQSKDWRTCLKEMSSSDYLYHEKDV